jgi:peptidoglycan-associated lipoprotein
MSQNRVLCLAAIAALAISAGCGKKHPIAPTPATPAPMEGSRNDPEATAKPVAPSIAEFVAEPGSILRGQASTLKWSVSNASEITVEPAIGALSASGTRGVYPSATTVYTLRATGPGGTVTAAATVKVGELDIAPPPTSDSNKSREGTLTFSQRLEREVKDAYFDYDHNDLRADAVQALTEDAVALKAIFRDFPMAAVAVEGHSDERGSAEYNLGLGDRRAQSAQQFLIQQGIPADRLRLISYGKERPQCTDANEACWQRNRRVHLVPGIQ